MSRFPKSELTRASERMKRQRDAQIAAAYDAEVRRQQQEEELRDALNEAFGRLFKRSTFWIVVAYANNKWFHADWIMRRLCRAAGVESVYDSLHPTPAPEGAMKE